MHMFISFLVCYVFVLHVPWIEGNCCGCVDVNSVTTCISGELDRVPVILNPSVETLIIHKNPIRIVGSEISHYKKLTYIDISQNEINFLSSSSFKFNQKLVHINLSSNNITNITSGIFGTSELPLKFLHTINLRNNSVAHVDSSTFDNTGNIELLDLGKNQLVHVNLTTTGLLNLKYLLLDNNLLTLIPVLVFGSHSSLRAFRLSANKGIKSIPDFSFQSVGSIELLDLSGCRISEVGTNAFYGLSKLISLNLTNNILATIPSSSFQSLGSLETLKIGGNIFETIANSSFVPLANLKYLEIINVTTLASIQQDAFSFSANIEEIVVSQCRRLTYIPETIFHHTLMLRVLDLRDNALKSIPRGIEKVEKVFIEGNDIKCDCEFLKLKERLERKKLTCNWPEEQAENHMGQNEMNSLVTKCSLPSSSSSERRWVIFPAAFLLISFILWYFIAAFRRKCCKYGIYVQNDSYDNDEEIENGSHTGEHHEIQGETANPALQTTEL